MILLVALAIAIAAGLIGGDPRRLAELHIRGTSVVALAMAVQIAVINVLPSALPQQVAEGAHLATYLAVAWVVWLNRMLPWMWLVAVGGAGNLAAIAANGGVMPASPSALARAGMSAASEDFANSTAVTHARLPWLGDVFAVPEGWPLSNVFSAGDVLLVLGAFLLVRVTARTASSTVPQEDGIAFRARVEAVTAGTAHVPNGSFHRALPKP